MVDVQSTSDARPETRAAIVEPKSAFKVYMEQNTEMPEKILKVLLHLYQEPAKESQAKAKVMELLNIEEDVCDVEALKAENKAIRHEIFDLHDTVKELEDKLAEIREDSI